MFEIEDINEIIYGRLDALSLIALSQTTRAASSRLKARLSAMLEGLSGCMRVFKHPLYSTWRQIWRIGNMIYRDIPMMVAIYSDGRRRNILYCNVRLVREIRALQAMTFVVNGSNGDKIYVYTACSGARFAAFVSGDSICVLYTKDQNSREYMLYQAASILMEGHEMNGEPFALDDEIRDMIVETFGVSDPFELLESRRLLEFITKLFFCGASYV